MATVLFFSTTSLYVAQIDDIFSLGGGTSDGFFCVVTTK